jgi:O-antigen/teichoic acid export membrane protein
MTSYAHRLVSGSALRVCTLFVSIGVTFFLTPFVIHSLGDRMYGFWVLVGTFIGYYGLLDFGLSNAIGRHISRTIGSKNQEECNRVFNTGLALYLCIGFLALLVTIVIVGIAYLFIKNPDDLLTFRTVILILGVHTAIEIPIRVFQGLLNANLRFNILSYITLINLFIRTTLIVFALTQGYRLIGMALAIFLASIIPNILYVHFAIKSSPYIRLKAKSISKKTSKTLFSYSFFVFVLQIAGRLRFQTDAFVITAFVGLSSVAHYNIASVLIRYFDVLMGRIMGVLTPYFSQLDGANDYEELKKKFFIATKLSVCISTFVGFGFVFWGKPFIQRWVGAEYLDAFPVLAILVSGVIFSFWQTPSITVLYGTSKHQVLAIVAVIEGLANLLISLLLVKTYGLIGVAAGTSIPLIINKGIFQPIYICRVLSISYLKYTRELIKYITRSLVALIIPSLISIQFISADYRSLVCFSIVSAFCYLSGIWLLILTDEEKNEIKANFWYRFSKKGAVNI